MATISYNRFGKIDLPREMASPQRKMAVDPGATRRPPRIFRLEYAGKIDNMLSNETGHEARRHGEEEA